MQGKGVQVDAKELNIESLQNTANYNSTQQKIEGQVTVGFGGASASGSANKTNINANYASVQDQAGIYAGDDGYQINVKNNTDLKGAIITSNPLAETLNKNSLSTGTLKSSNIQNVTEYDAKGISVGGGFNAGKSGTAGNKEPDTVLSTPNKIDQHASTTVGVSKSVGFGLDSDKDSSVTKSGVNTQNITIRDEQGQQALTGKTAGKIKSEILTSVTTDTARENSGALQNNFDKDRVLKEINTQVSVTQKFGENAPKAVADYAQQQVLKLQAQGNLEEAEKWKEGGVYRIAMHTALGALGTGTLEGAITTGTVAASAPKINDFQNSVAQALTHTGMSEKAAEAVASGVTSLTLASAGVAAGLNTGSTATAINVDSNNRQLHVDEAKVLKKLTEGKSKQEQDRLRAAACALVKCSEGVPESDVNYKSLKAFEALGETYTKEKNALKATGLFTYSDWDIANDFRTNNDKIVSKGKNAGQAVIGAVGTVGGALATGSLALACPGTGIACAGAVVTGAGTGLSAKQAVDGVKGVLGTYESNEGKKVLDSYNPNRTDSNSALTQDGIDLAVTAGEAALAIVGGKVVTKYGGAAIDKLANSKNYDFVKEIEKLNLGKIEGKYSAISSGPLANNLAETFAGGKYAVITLDKDTILYRAGIEGQPLGQFFSLEKPKSVIQTRIDKAILPEWPNGAKSPLDTSYSIKIPAGTKIYVGDVGTQRDFYLGGTQQIVVPKPWTIKDVKVVESSSLK